MYNIPCGVYYGWIFEGDASCEVGATSVTDPENPTMYSVGAWGMVDSGLETNLWANGGLAQTYPGEPILLIATIAAESYILSVAGYSVDAEGNVDSALFEWDDYNSFVGYLW